MQFLQRFRNGVRCNVVFIRFQSSHLMQQTKQKKNIIYLFFGKTIVYKIGTKKITIYLILLTIIILNYLQIEGKLVINVCDEFLEFFKYLRNLKQFCNYIKEIFRKIFNGHIFSSNFPLEINVYTVQHVEIIIT